MDRGPIVYAYLNLSERAERARHPGGLEVNFGACVDAARHLYTGQILPRVDLNATRTRPCSATPPRRFVTSISRILPAILAGCGFDAAGSPAVLAVFSLASGFDTVSRWPVSQCWFCERPGIVPSRMLQVSVIDIGFCPRLPFAAGNAQSMKLD
jgi:hypothetical protein